MWFYYLIGSFLMIMILMIYAPDIYDLFTKSNTVSYSLIDKVEIRMVFIKRFLITTVISILISILFTFFVLNDLNKLGSVIIWVGILSIVFGLNSARYAQPNPTRGFAHFPSLIKHLMYDDQSIKFSPLIVSGILLLITPFIWFLIGMSGNDDVELSPLEFTKVSSTEYLIEKDDLSMWFEIKASDGNSIVDMNSYSFEFINVIEVTINDNEKIYYVIHLTEEYNDAFRFSYKFQNIEEQLKHLGELLDKYPARIENIGVAIKGLDSEDTRIRELYRIYLEEIYLKIIMLKDNGFKKKIVRTI
ncbi:hypothetical protein RI065_09650 [Mycoplasmatota bacterium zrk1]